MKFFSSALLAATLVSATFALPSALRDLSLDEVPSGSARLAFDEKTGIVTVFDKDGGKIGTINSQKSGSKSHKVQKRAGTCNAASTDDVQKIPGWGVITDQAKSFWGDGGYDLKTNLEEYPENPVNICTSDSPADVSVLGDPSCTKSAQSTQGQLAGSDGTVTLTNTYTETTSSSLTVTKSAAMGASLTLSATVGFPGIVDITTGFTTSVDITNTQSSESHTDKSNTLTQTVSMASKAGQTCKLDFNTATCVAHGTASVKFVATGWVWFAYHDRVQDHYFWALNMDVYLPNEDDRAQFIDVDAVVNLDSTSDYNGYCY